MRFAALHSVAMSHQEWSVGVEAMACMTWMTTIVSNVEGGGERGEGEICEPGSGEGVMISISDG